MLITLMSSLVDEDSFEMDLDTDTIKPKEDLFKDLEDSLETDETKERLDFVRNKLLEKVKEKAMKSRERRLSQCSSVCSLDSKKRKTSSELVNENLRSRTSSISSTQ